MEFPEDFLVIPRRMRTGILKFHRRSIAVKFLEELLVEFQDKFFVEFPDKFLVKFPFEFLVEFPEKLLNQSPEEFLMKFNDNLENGLKFILKDLQSTGSRSDLFEILEFTNYAAWPLYQMDFMPNGIMPNCMMPNRVAPF